MGIVRLTKYDEDNSTLITSDSFTVSGSFKIKNSAGTVLAEVDNNGNIIIRGAMVKAR